MAGRFVIGGRGVYHGLVVVCFCFGVMSICMVGRMGCMKED